MYGFERKSNQGPNESEIPAYQGIEIATGRAAVIPRHFARELENEPPAGVFDDPKADKVNECADEEELPAQRIMQRLVEEYNRAVHRERPERGFAYQQPVFALS